MLGVGRCYVHDPNRLVRPRYGKSSTRQIKAIAAGAFFRAPLRVAGKWRLDRRAASPSLGNLAQTSRSVRIESLEHCEIMSQHLGG